jgi:protein-disulfide isomerase
VVVIAGVAAGGYVLWNRFAGGDGGAASSSPPPGPAATSNDAPKGVALGAEGGVKPGMGNGIGEGSNPNATTVVELYEDFFCPHCATLETQAGDYLRAQANSGQIRIVRYPLTFVAGEQSKRAALAYACASDQDTSGKGEVASKVANQLFDSVAAEQANAVEDTAMEELSKQAPQPAEFMSCVQNQKFSAWVDSIGDSAEKRGVSSTPVVFVNGKEVTMDAGGNWLEAIQAALG